ncbi:hypothetical protein [Nocardia tengchongensis]|uniref:hypothetical protein n=1 Tax=Nocardia tengchongensis TaxID=2055889 RepID=UPI00366045CB
MNDVIVELFHNTSTDEGGAPVGVLHGYRPEHALTRVFTCLLRPPAADAAGIAQRVFDLSAGRPWDDDEALALAYSLRADRPLASGDVVRVFGDWLTCGGGRGWRELGARPALADTEVEERDVFVAVSALKAGDIVTAIGGAVPRSPIRVQGIVPRRSYGSRSDMVTIWEIHSRAMGEPPVFVHELGHVTISPVAARLIELAEDHELDANILDAVVGECHSREESEIYDGGFEAAIPYLIGQLGATEVETRLFSAAGWDSSTT